MSEQNQLLTVSEFADLIRMKPSGIRRWILERKIAVVRIGRLVRIPVSEVDRLITSGTRPAKRIV